MDGQSSRRLQPCGAPVETGLVKATLGVWLSPLKSDRLAFKVTLTGCLRAQQPSFAPLPRNLGSGVVW